MKKEITNQIIEEAKKYVGGHFEEGGMKQLDFLVEEGLKPEHYLLDIGCGMFRGGRFFIKYLQPFHYYGIEKHKWLVEAGLKEMGIESAIEKEFQVMIDDSFTFYWIGSEVPPKFDFVLAKSVFTHLTKKSIKLCLDNIKEDLIFNTLKGHPNTDLKFYASIFIGDSNKNPKQDDDTKKFMYSIKEIQELVNGWNIEDMGHKGCFYQNMLKFTINNKIK